MRENLVVLPYTRVRFKWIAVGILLLCATLLMLASQPAFAQQNDPQSACRRASTAPSAPEAPARIVRYVDGSATGSNDGTSWANAYTDLQTALANSVSGTDLWIAAGTYAPHATDRSVSFMLKNGVSLYGGFPRGGGDGTFADRFPAGNLTVLSGNVGDVSTETDNSYHVVYALDINLPVVLDGIIVAEGYADQGWPNNVGSGLFLENSLVLLRNCLVQGNYGKDGTPALRAQNGGYLIIENCRFFGNSSNGQGSALILSNTAVSIQRSQFKNNSATGSIGPVWVQNSTFSIFNTVIANNSNNQLGGGAVYLDGASGGSMRHLTISGHTIAAVSVGSESNTWITNSILWGNGSPEIEGTVNMVDSSIVQGGYPGGTNISSDSPEFLSSSDLRLGSSSPAKDNANPSACMLEDIQGYPAPTAMGATWPYEMYTQSSICEAPNVSISDNDPAGKDLSLDLPGTGTHPRRGRPHPSHPPLRGGFGSLPHPAGQRAEPDHPQPSCQRCRGRWQWGRCGCVLA